MATSKATRSTAPETRRIAQLFDKSQISKDRRQVWEHAVAQGAQDPILLRFPIYDRLYHLNACAQKMVDLIAEIGNTLKATPDDTLYRQYVVQEIRSLVTSDVLDQMSGVEHLESWLFESLGREELKKLRDPEDVYLLVRQQEEERARKGEAPRVRFLDEKGDGAH